ncbi:MAG TPA: nucleoside triphosphate pyrophosphohydrolase [Anseongella sp.]
MDERLKAFERLLNIMDELREKCPWDRKQTMESLRHLTLEEVYELSDAILEGDMTEISKELGDIMLHLVFYAKIGAEQKAFDISGVLNGICEKLIARHPHIYGDVKVENEEQVKQNWEKLKLKEGNRSVLEGVPVSLPSLVKAQRIQDKVAGVGFDWEESSQVWEKVEEELREFRSEFMVEDGAGNEAAGGSDRNANDIAATTKEEARRQRAEAEFGDVLFSLINYARFLDINPENALEKTNRKFIKRFRYLEDKARENGRLLKDMSLAEMDVFWEQAKKEG